MPAEGEARAITRTSSPLARPARPVIPVTAAPAFAAAAGAGARATRTRAVPVGTITVRSLRAIAIGAIPLRAVSVRTAARTTVVVAGFGPPRGAIPRLGPQGLQGTDRQGGRHQEQERAAHVILLSC